MGILLRRDGDRRLGRFVSSAYRVQVEDGAAWRKRRPSGQRQRRLHIEPKRGTIFDRNGRALAVSVDVPSVSADVVEMLRGAEGDAAQAAALKDAAARLGQALSLDAGELYARLATRRRFVWIKRRISEDEAASIRELSDLRGSRPLHQGPHGRRGKGIVTIRGASLPGRFLGSSRRTARGGTGSKLSLDDELRGHVEEVKGLRDRGGRLLFSQGTTDESALQGHDVLPHARRGDPTLGGARARRRAEDLRDQVGPSIVVVDPNSEEILALSSTPGYNPNDYTPSQTSTRAVTAR